MKMRYRLAAITAMASILGLTFPAWAGGVDRGGEWAVGIRRK